MSSARSVPSWRVREQKGPGPPPEREPPGRAGEGPLGRPSPWLRARNEEEQKSRGGVSAPPAPQVRKTGLLWEPVSWDMSPPHPDPTRPRLSCVCRHLGESRSGFETRGFAQASRIKPTLQRGTEDKGGI